MTFPEGDRPNIEKRRALLEEDAKRHLNYLHGIADGTILDQFSIAGYIDENLLHNLRYNTSPLQFILEFEIAQTAFDRIRSAVVEKPNAFPRVRSEVVKGRERYVMRITPTRWSPEAREAIAEETTLQLQADWENSGFLLVEVPHPDLPERLKREFVNEPLAAKEVLDISVLLLTPPRRNTNTFKSAKEIVEERIKAAEFLALGFQELTAFSPDAQDLLGEVLQGSAGKDEEELGPYPSDLECGMTEDNYWYFTSKYGEHGEVTDPKDIELRNFQWDALRRRMAHDMRTVRRIRNSGNN